MIAITTNMEVTITTFATKVVVIDIAFYKSKITKIF